MMFALNLKIHNATVWICKTAGYIVHFRKLVILTFDDQPEWRTFVGVLHLFLIRIFFVNFVYKLQITDNKEKRRQCLRMHLKPSHCFSEKRVLVNTKKN